MVKINVILGSSREASLGKSLFNYLVNQQNDYQQQIDLSLNFVAVGDYQLPFFYEALPPMNNHDRQLPTEQQAWLEDMAAADGYIFLTPEYNHSFPAVLKNALDYLAGQCAQKPAIVMSYSDNIRGGQFGGVDLGPVLTRLGFFVLPPQVVIGNVQKNFQADGQLLADAPSKDFYTNVLRTTVQKIAFYSQLFKDNPFVPVGK